MVRRASFHHAALTLGVALAATTMGAQGLGDAARKAEEQRKAAAGATIVIRELPTIPEGGPPRLTEQLLLRYLDARVALADLRRADKGLNQRFHSARNKTRHYDELEAVYAREGAIVDLFSSFDLTPYRYVEIERALYRGLEFSGASRVSIEHLSARDQENVRFVAAHRTLAEHIRVRYKAAENGLPFQGFIQQYF